MKSFGAMFFVSAFMAQIALGGGAIHPKAKRLLSNQFKHQTSVAMSSAGLQISLQELNDERSTDKLCQRLGELAGNMIGSLTLLPFLTYSSVNLERFTEEAERMLKLTTSLSGFCGVYQSSVGIPPGDLKQLSDTFEDLERHYKHNVKPSLVGI